MARASLCNCPCDFDNQIAREVIMAEADWQGNDHVSTDADDLLKQLL